METNLEWNLDYAKSDSRGIRGGVKVSVWNCFEQERKMLHSREAKTDNWRRKCIGTCKKEFGGSNWRYECGESLTRGLSNVPETRVD